MDSLLKLSARQVIALLKHREVSPMDLIDVAANRIATTDGTINALPTLCLERGREHARKLMDAPPVNPPPNYLYGLPIAVKDLDEVAGVRTTKGSPIFADYVPDRSDIAVEMLERNGAVVIAKSNTPEFGAGSNTFNEVFGATRNPWNIQMTAGGSSGGSAAALAAGQVWLATGSDLGGSVRIPASYCSVVGLRPSPGRVAFSSDTTFDSLGVQGQLGRSVEDVALMLDAQVGEHIDDPRSLAKPAIPFIEAVDHPIKPRRIGYSSNLGIAPVDGEVKEICAKAASSFTNLGSVVDEACPDLHDAEEIFQVLRSFIFAARLSPLLKSHRHQLKPELVWNIEKGLALSADELGRAVRAHSAFYHRTATFFQTYDLLLSPAVVAPPFNIDIRYLREVEGISFDSYVGWLVLSFAITLTTCPAISVPCGFTRTGLPVGLQIVGPPRGEAMVLSAAALLENMVNLLYRVPIDPRSGANF